VPKERTPCEITEPPVRKKSSSNCALRRDSEIGRRLCHSGLLAVSDNAPSVGTLSRRTRSSGASWRPCASACRPIRLAEFGRDRSRSGNALSGHRRGGASFARRAANDERGAPGSFKPALLRTAIHAETISLTGFSGWKACLSRSRAGYRSAGSLICHLR